MKKLLIFLSLVLSGSLTQITAMELSSDSDSEGYYADSEGNKQKSEPQKIRKKKNLNKTKSDSFDSESDKVKVIKRRLKDARMKKWLNS